MVLFCALSMIILLFITWSCGSWDAFNSSTPAVTQTTSHPAGRVEFTSIQTAVSPTSTQAENQQIMNQPTATSTEQVLVTPSFSLWRDLVPDEVWETKYKLETIEYTEHDFHDFVPNKICIFL